MLHKRMKPDWIKVQLGNNKSFKDVKQNLRSNRLHTVCEEAKCPNVHECWGRRTATFMILGDVCTRSCRFCAVKTGRPFVYDEEEPARVAESVRSMGLQHVVITSVNRDELPDGGSAIWAAVIRKVREVNPGTSIEVLTPDFKGIWGQLKTVLDAGPDVYSHNLETIPSLYKDVRPQAKYHRSLRVFKNARNCGFLPKTGIMVGLGESFGEIVELMKNVADTSVDIFTVGQYLQPTPSHLPVERYVHPDEFKEYKKVGEELGIGHVEAGPLVRSSYHAESQFARLRNRWQNQASSG
ncbi:MAG: lipoyl synthase [Calditrichia bacterium]